MRFLVWLLGVFMILLGLQAKGPGLSGWTVVWICAAVLWFFAGVVMAGITLTKLAAGKVGAGVLRRNVTPPLAPPAPHKEA